MQAQFSSGHFMGNNGHFRTFRASDCTVIDPIQAMILKKSNYMTTITRGYFLQLAHRHPITKTVVLCMADQKMSHNN
jgi:hypothetical protein